MPIDARIPLGVTGPDPNGFTNALAAGMKMRAVQNEADRLARKDELAETETSSLSRYLAGDRSPESKQLLASESPSAFLKADKAERETKASAATTGKAEAETYIKRIEIGARLLGGAKDQPTYEAATVEATNAGLDTSHWPKKFFSDWVANQRQQAFSTLDQANLQHKQDSLAETRDYHDRTLLGQEEGRDATESRFQQGQQATENRFQQAQQGIEGRHQDTQDRLVKDKGADLRKEFNALPVVKNYNAVVPVIQSAREAATTDTAAADMNLVYAVAKVNDPESVVRESETAMVVASGSPAHRFLGQFNYVAGGGRLTAEQRKELMNELESRAGAHEKLYNDAVTQYQSGAPEIGSSPVLDAGRNRSQQPKSSELTATETPTYRYFKNRYGLSDVGAFAMARNITQESGHRTDVRGDGGKAQGLAQWHPDRWAKYEKWADEQGLDPKSKQAQMDYIIEEGKNYPGYESLKGNDPEAVRTFIKNFEGYGIEGARFSGLDERAAQGGGASKVEVSADKEPPAPTPVKVASQEAGGNKVLTSMPKPQGQAGKWVTMPDGMVYQSDGNQWIRK
jgi:hypothetical protein